jgi:hypothetical protein
MAAAQSPANAIENDPVGSATAALSSAGAALGSATGEMAAHAQGFLPAAGRFLLRAVYVSCYSASYGVTFPAVLLVNVIPGGIPLAAGLADGARAARDYVRGLRSRAAEETTPPREPPGEAPAATGTNAVEEFTAKSEGNHPPTAEVKGRRPAPARKETIAPALRQVKAPGRRKKSSG